ncbi:hypothetical protein VTO42DRAFT_8596 [Malbranchea cinnamomea]
MASSNGDRDSPERHSSTSTASSIPRQFVSITRTESGTSRRRASTGQSARLEDARAPGAYGTVDQLPFGASTSRSSPDLTQSPKIFPQSVDRTPRKPPTVRRLSSKPYRGQEFSVDDDVNEYEEDQALRQSQSSSRLGRTTLRRRPRAHSPSLRRVGSRGLGEADDSVVDTSTVDGRLSRLGRTRADEGEDDINDDENDDDNDDEVDLSDAESFTLKDRQQAINETHPFGIRIWKPALYKKFRSVEKTAEGDIHSVPGERVSFWLFVVNICWTLLFGWWLALTALTGALACFVFGFSPDSTAYGRVFLGCSSYLFWPFGSFVGLQSDENYAAEDEGEGRSISEYEQWQSGDLEHGRLFFGPVSGRSLVGRRRNSIDSGPSETDSLLGRAGRRHSGETTLYRHKRRFFGRGEWTLGRVVFYTFFYLLVGPLMLLVSLLCWLMVFWIPMGRVTLILFDHLRRHPLALSFHPDSLYSRFSARPASSSVLLCTYRAAGLQYWKYTVDGTNIFFINLLSVVILVILDYWVLYHGLGVQSWLTHPGLLFTLALLSVVPLAYFIGQAVASISAQSSMGMGAAVNAFFSTVVEVYLYCVALTEGKARLVEGSIIGSLFAGILFLPGLSMCFGAIRRKTQRFNVKSAGVTSTMLLFAVVAAFGPTLFYQIYGSRELHCRPCTDVEGRDCRRCYFAEVPEVQDQFFRDVVQPYCWFAAVLLFLSYVIGLWFTLRTHAAIIWASEIDEKKPPPLHHRTDASSLLLQGGQQPQPQNTADGRQAGLGRKGSIRQSKLYARILGQSLSQVGLAPEEHEGSIKRSDIHVVPPKDDETARPPTLSLPGLSEEQNKAFVRQVTEVAATAATVAARDATRRKNSHPVPVSGIHTHCRQPAGRADPQGQSEETEETVEQNHSSPSGGHDAPNWGKTKSTVILLVATVAYAIIAEILVNTVDVVLESVDIDEKFLGITLFALVPNTTEFLNAISFAMNGNIALSMEIGSAYALQVCLLQIPALVLFSAIHSRFLAPSELLHHSFTLIFPQFDMVTVILCVFLLSYVYGEGKSNYFKGSILVLTYLFVVAGFFLAKFGNDVDGRGVDRYDTLAIGAREKMLLISMRNEL